jgi:hypothetical protein
VAVTVRASVVNADTGTELLDHDGAEKSNRVEISLLHLGSGDEVKMEIHYADDIDEARFIVGEECIYSYLFRHKKQPV